MNEFAIFILVSVVFSFLLSGSRKSIQYSKIYKYQTISIFVYALPHVAFSDRQR